MTRLASQAKAASRELARLTTAEKNSCLLEMADALEKNGAAIKVNNLATFAHKVGPLLESPERLAQLKASARRLGRPRAAFDVVERSLELLKNTTS